VTDDGYEVGARSEARECFPEADLKGSSEIADAIRSKRTVEPIPYFRDIEIVGR